MTTADWGFDATGGMDEGRRDAVRWTAAAAAAAALYAGVTVAILLQPEDAAPALIDPAGAVMVELSPIVAAPDTPMRDVATGAESEASPEQEVSEPKPKENQLQEEETKLPEFDKAEAIIEQARPEPQPEKPVEKKPVEKKPEEQKPQRQKSTARAAAAPRPNKARHAAFNAAPSAGVSSSASAASWRSAVVGHLNRHKRHPGGASNGTASVAFAIDRQGRVLWARLTRSSGSSQLDAEAVSLARRASPVPAPPAEMARGTITLSVPLRFTR
ncbi:TonB family protein [Rhodomicrobium vannielii ATCC 17100]|uniref:TonB family protein n=1 Tax=Rhodomicrobium vannielii (strain ATCC 17100 / DSM 162 / LMG 4299 / NCIMB 10020 / ATH 3.1.1) TaxID=648757 RepID=E3I669_RHOVT|nr:TonB family protein [Rhodomicrobium vannielii]ADP71734.1 TonB family protein [Rhodomicrobium vannielii ATCC 17100]